MEDKMICSNCEIEIDEFGDYYGNEITGKTYCWGCVESDMSMPSVLYRINPLEPMNKVSFGSLAVFGEDGDAPSWFMQLIGHIDETVGSDNIRNWVATDGWRGHFDSYKSLTGVKLLASGWTTGWVDDSVRRKETFNNWFEQVSSGQDIPTELFVLVEPTSNVFSVSVSVFCFEDDYRSAREYLDETADLEYALS